MVAAQSWGRVLITILFLYLTSFFILSGCDDKSDKKETIINHRVEERGIATNCSFISQGICGYSHELACHACLYTMNGKFVSICQ